MNGEASEPKISVFRPPPFWVLLGIVVLLAGSVGLGLFDWLTKSDSDIFKFIALLIIFMTALAACAVIFAGLGMQNPAEAFGLPPGSVRPLLAIGIMILLVVFGLPAIAPPEGDMLAPREVAVPAAQLDSAVRFHRDQGLNVRILAYGAAAAPATATGPAVTAAPARIEISGRAETRSTAQGDLIKQLLTAIITLLTTIVGFYFGSRSVSEAARVAAANMTTSPPPKT